MGRLSEEEKNKLYEDVRPIALECRKSIINENDVINDTFGTIERLGILLLRFPALNNDTSLCGFTLYKHPYNCIYINTRQNLGRQYISCWHEYYHIYTGEGTGLSYLDSENEDPIEYKATLFASMILMPENLVRKYVEDRKVNLEFIKHTDIIKMQNYFGVGHSAMLTRLIQIFPEYKDNMQNRYGIAGKSQKQRERLEEKTIQADGNLHLIKATNDIYVPNSFYDDLEMNMKEKRISKEKAYSLLEIIGRLQDDI